MLSRGSAESEHDYEPRLKHASTAFSHVYLCITFLHKVPANGNHAENGAAGLTLVWLFVFSRHITFNLSPFYGRVRGLQGSTHFLLGTRWEVKLP